MSSRAVRKEVIRMDGGDTAHCDRRTLPALRVRLGPDKVIEHLLDPSVAPVKKPVPWVFGEQARLDVARVDGKAWLLVHGVPAGLPILPDPRRHDDRLNWRYLWEEMVVEIDRQIAGIWKPFEETGELEALEDAWGT